MSEPYIRPVLDGAVEIMRETLNTKINEISINGLSEPPKDIDDRMYYTHEHVFGEDWPFVNVFILGEAEVNSEEETGGVITMALPIITEINYQAEDENELELYGDIYLTAMMRSLTAGSNGNIWTFNQTAMTVALIRIGLSPITGEDEDRTIMGACFALWEATIQADPAAD